MKVAAIPDARSELANPASATWKGISHADVPLGPLPLATQPTPYIREAWANRPYGTTAKAQVAAATDGDELYIRLQWADAAEPNGEFQDAGAAIFPTAGSAPAMGSSAAPVGLWYWEDGRNAALNLTSSGPGVVRKDGGGNVHASAVLAEGQWAVVLRGPLAAASSGQFGVAVWNGSNEERAGLAAVTTEWLPLELA